MSDLWVVIPAAGQSRRFKEAGYLGDKAALMVKPPSGEPKEMIRHVIDSIPATVSSSNIVVGVPNPWGLSLPVNMVGIDHSSGQADTIHQILRHLPAQDRVLILDCDMLVWATDQQILIDMLEIYDVTIAVTETFDPNSSRVDQVPHPTRFVEKEPISQWGIVGARGFKNIGTLSLALRGLLNSSDKWREEPYLSTAINDYPGKKFAHVIIDYVDLGTPDRIKESGWTIV